MPFKLIWEPRRLQIKFDGFVTNAEFLGAAQALQNDARFEDVRARIYDFSDITGFDLSAGTLDLLIAMTVGVSAYCPHGSMAFVIVDANLTQAARQYFAGVAGLYPAEVFTSLREAWDWAENAS